MTPPVVKRLPKEIGSVSPVPVMHHRAGEVHRIEPVDVQPEGELVLFVAGEVRVEPADGLETIPLDTKATTREQRDGPIELRFVEPLLAARLASHRGLRSYSS